MASNIPKIFSARFRRVGGASCKIGVCRSIPQHMQKLSREISELRTDPEQRRKGYATTLLHSICKEADQVGMLLILHPQVYQESEAETVNMMSQTLLEAWYSAEFGFQMIQTEPVKLMARMPGSTPKVSMRLSNTTRAFLETIK